MKTNIQVCDIEAKPVGYDAYRAGLCGQRPDGSPEGNATEDPAAKREPATAKELGLHGRDAYVHGLVTASRRAPAAKPTTGNTSGGK